MPAYKAPVRDLQFVLEDVFNVYETFQQLPGAEETTPDVGQAIMQEAGKFCEEVLHPLNQTGDTQGCKWEDGNVTTPDGFKEAYQSFIEMGWPALDQSADYGGQGLPHTLGLAVREMLGTSNWAWSMYPGLSHGCMDTILEHGTDEQKNAYLPNLIAGKWTGTMCLTEAHCGTDLGLLRTKATPNEDGSYAISGTKIFISAGEHDMSENIVHIVLAKLPDAPEGTKGISLFIVPKFLTDGNGNVTDRNGVNCGSLEHKMGIHGNATCVLNFDNATGYLIGQPNRGLQCMFTFMNAARIGTGMQGLAHAEYAFQNSLAYAKERLQMRSLSGTKAPDQPADPIIVHPDVRRMLLTQKAFAEGGRAFSMYAGELLDIETKHPDIKARGKAADQLALLTPILKAFMTEVGFESANLGLQCFGGHGYINEWGMEQNVRDSRISTLYEGTTGIQALDLLGRKVLRTRGGAMKTFTGVVKDFCKQNSGVSEVKPQLKKLNELNKEWLKLTQKIGLKALRNRDAVGAASVDFLMYSGYVVLAYFWARSSVAAQKALDAGTDDKAFMEAKLKTAEFYYRCILPRTRMHAKAMLAGPKVVMQLEEENFIF
ncbi:MAG: acyl-CoA dehydrogenase [Pseudomonadales bacterium]|nr:acyl-CoA dehydrogenase [Pseudomonadales bacterium]